MKTIISFVIIFLLTQSAVAYPPDKLGSILAYKYPDAKMGTDIIVVKNVGCDPFVMYSIYLIPDAVEMESLWIQLQEKQALEKQNQTKKTISKQDLQTKYQNQIDNLNTVVNNSNYIQAKTNWTNAEVIQYMKVLAWNDEVLAKGEIVILKILRWMT